MSSYNKEMKIHRKEGCDKMLFGNFFKIEFSIQYKASFL